MDDTTPSDASVVALPGGVPGLSDSATWTLSPLAGSGDDSAFWELSASDDPDIALIVTDPWTFFGDYAPDLPDDELEAIEVSEPAMALVVCPVTLDADAGCIYVNLLGPIVFNTSTGTGRQMVLSDQDLPVRARVELADA